MKKLFVMLGLLPFATAAFAQDSAGTVARWGSIVGVITAVNVDNPVGNISSGTFAWSARTGHAEVNLTTGAASFAVDGLVINGTAFSGTPGPVTAVTGTLVCNPGRTGQAFDTEPVRLDKQGRAQFVGEIANIPANCANPLFLLRIATPAGAAGRWIASGAERIVSRSGI